jgi:hypothetical protein
MKLRFCAGIAFAFCACVAGCASTGSSPATIGTAAISAMAAAPVVAGGAISIGKSTRADVLAALGKTTVVGFDSGFEVWVYRVSGETESAAGPGWLERILRAGSQQELSRGTTEFVILFAPTGVVAKTRIRPAPVPF